MMSQRREEDRIKAVYASYGSDLHKRQQWDSENPGNKQILKERETTMSRMLRSYVNPTLADLKILEVGCGTGRILASLLPLGARPSNLFGVDLMADRINAARENFPQFNFTCANAESLDFQDASFDMVIFFTVFSSILDPIMSNAVASEGNRVLKPGGVILFYDFRYENPWNPHVRGVTKEEVLHLFRGFSGHLKSLSVLPPLVRRLGAITPVVYPVLSLIPFLRTHYLGLLRKP